MSDHPTFLATVVLAATLPLAAGESIPIDAKPRIIVSTAAEPTAAGRFEPTWESLARYEAPDWFRDAKFGIWAHWGPQCEPEAGDWYARKIYFENDGKSKLHRERYGHPSEFGFKDVIHRWKAEKWDPDRLVKLYKRVGAKYFFAMANHHDNLDLWDSSHQPWNSVAVGPEKDLIAGWAKAAREQGLPFGVSVHASHAWSWYEGSQGADQSGDKAGVPYDGKLTKADGKGTWWDGLDPQDLYAQNHAPSPDFLNQGALHGRWGWGGGVSQPDLGYCQKFHDRTAELIRIHQPDLLYFDDTALPLWPVSDAGLKLAAHFYNSNLAKSGGTSNGVLFGKILDDKQLDCLTWDIERGVPNRLLPHPWQTDTCLGSWHYNRGVYQHNRYKSAKTVIHMLVDIVSKNGNLLLSVPVRGNGSIDEKEEAILEGIGAWMDVNQEAIFGTRPWKVFGEGPASEGTELSAQGFNEGKGKPFTAADIRFTTKDGFLYAISCGVTDQPLAIRSLAAKDAPKVASIRQLGCDDKIEWQQDDDALTITPSPAPPAGDAAVVFKITPH